MYGALISQFRGGYLINQPSGDILGPETVTTQIAGLPIEISFLKEKEIAKFKLPERLLICDDFPVSTFGKVSKKALAELAQKNANH